jgi:hypothetical protein
VRRVERSALIACLKLAESPIQACRAILIEGFDYIRQPLSETISAFETLARARVNLGPRTFWSSGPL